MNQKVLTGFALNPNVYGVVIIGLGCETVPHAKLRGKIQAMTSKPVVSFGSQEAVATLTAPGCAACLGIHQGLLAEGEACISSTNRNFPGRMGNVKGEIYLGSPASVAAAAIEGAIADPRKYLEGRGEA